MFVYRQKSPETARPSQMFRRTVTISRGGNDWTRPGQTFAAFDSSKTPSIAVTDTKEGCH